MKNVKLLDCTLRDGGRIIDCKFLDEEIGGISKRLAESKIDIVELGFLRDWRNVRYEGNSTFFTNPEQMDRFMDDNNNTIYVAFIDYGMFDFDSLPVYRGKGIKGLRIGFTKKNYNMYKTDIIQRLTEVKEKGYLLFIQGVNTLGYSDKELLDVIDMVNNIHPYSYGIVDTYGAMYIDDLQRIYTLVDHNLKQDICINFHSHNNFQLSFSFAQEIIKYSRGIRNLIIDGTLNGMGKVAGNLNTELIVDYMNRKLDYEYNCDLILDTIDDYIYKYAQQYKWGYSIPGVMAGVYKSHPNNIIFLTEQLRLATKDIKYLLSMIEPNMRQTYDYDNIRRLYKQYNHENVDDVDVLKLLKSVVKERKTLLLFPGKSIDIYMEEIREFVAINDVVIFAANFIPKEDLGRNIYYFFGSEKRYNTITADVKEEKCILVSNIRNRKGNELVVNYEQLVDREREYFDNTGIMLLNLMKKLNAQDIYIAGFDGFEAEKNNYSQEREFGEARYKDRFEKINEEIRESLYGYANSIRRKSTVHFLTPSLFEDVFKENEE